MKYISTQQVSEKWGIFSRRIQIFCNENRVPGVQKVGRPDLSI